MNISDILRHKDDTRPTIVTVAPDDTVADLLATLAEHNVGAAVVLEGETVRGIVSERDVVRALARKGPAVLDRPTGELMTTKVLSCSGDDSVDAIAETMTQQRIRHLPVIDGSTLVGIVSIGDVVSSRMRQLEHDRGQLEQYIAG